MLNSHKVLLENISKQTASGRPRKTTEDKGQKFEKAKAVIVLWNNIPSCV